ncbi:MAG: bifunctional (p)ppGpp synthetase/guanosine-3',5'-bis(diphosphate) 3'-pyrophosphohydrolase [Armatimonadetes bacterium]|nr:bifunctional (p)ppGpp synthetase/guanosine-3',5'-bis(diphosphate) 3'-pyrophosphohydrolase [Armatimonadota bacterium]
MSPDLVQEAVVFAAERHQGQWRDGDSPVPYLCHPLEVLTTLRYEGGVTDPVLMAAAVLHDVMEETETSASELKEHFGAKVAKLVQELTRHEPTSEETKGMNKDEIWSLRAGMLLDEIRSMGKDAMTVKLCDRLSNLRESRHAKKGKKLDRYVAQSEEILKIVPRTTNPALWDALQALVASMKVKREK